MRWITREDLISHVVEYGERSYAYILYEDKRGFLDIAIDLDYAIEKSRDDGMFVVVQLPERDE